MTTTTTAVSGLRRPFLASDGRLHLAWRVALYLLSWWVVFIVAAVVGSLVAAALHWPDMGKNALVAAVAIPLLIAWTRFYRRHVDRRSVRGIGLTAPASGLPQLGAGFLAGTALIGVWLLIDLALGWVRIVGGEPATSGLWLTAGFVLVGLLANAGAGFLEETGYRGYVLQNLGERMPLWAATPLSAFLFAIVVHFNKLTPLFVVIATAIGVLFALTRLATDAIWFAIGLHWAWDGAQNYLFGLGHPSAPYGHSVLHVQVQGWLVPSGGGEDPVALGLILLAVAGCLLWLRRDGRVGWRSRLDEEGRPSSRSDPAG